MLPGTGRGKNCWQTKTKSHSIGVKWNKLRNLAGKIDFAGQEERFDDNFSVFFCFMVAKIIPELENIFINTTNNDRVDDATKNQEFDNDNLWKVLASKEYSN